MVLFVTLLWNIWRNRATVATWTDEGLYSFGDNLGTNCRLSWPSLLFNWFWQPGFRRWLMIIIQQYLHSALQMQKFWCMAGCHYQSVLYVTLRSVRVGYLSISNWESPSISLLVSCDRLLCNTPWNSLVTWASFLWPRSIWNSVTNAQYVWVISLRIRDHSLCVVCCKLITGQENVRKRIDRPSAVSLESILSESQIGFMFLCVNWSHTAYT